MSADSSIWLVTEREDTVASVSAALEASSRFDLGKIYRGFPDLLSHMEREPASVILVDIDPQPISMLANLDAVTKAFSDTRFVVLSNTLSNDLVLESMQAGARSFLHKDTIAAELCTALQRLVQNGVLRTESQGGVVTVLSAGGGCGATTLAVNLAHELSKLDDGPALLLDLDCCYGGSAAHLGLSGQYGLADVLARNGELDAELISTTALRYSDDLRVLLNPSTINPGSTVPLDYGRLRKVVQMSKDAFSHTVIDAPRLPMEVAADLIAVSDATLLVLQLTVKDLATVRAMLSALRDQHISVERISLVANRCRKRGGMISLEEAKAALNTTIHHCLPNDYDNAVKSMNMGQPLAQAVRRSPLQREFKRLATEIREAGSTLRSVHLGA